MESLVDRKFNVKCVVISGGVVGAYYALPPDHLWGVAMLAIGLYVGNAWYDHTCKCADQLFLYDSLWTTLTKMMKSPVGVNMRYMC